MCPNTQLKIIIATFLRCLFYLRRSSLRYDLIILVIEMSNSFSFFLYIEFVCTKMIEKTGDDEFQSK